MFRDTPKLQRQTGLPPHPRSLILEMPGHPGALCYIEISVVVQSAK